MSGERRGSGSKSTAKPDRPRGSLRVPPLAGSASSASTRGANFLAQLPVLPGSGPATAASRTSQLSVKLGTVPSRGSVHAELTGEGARGPPLSRGATPAEARTSTTTPSNVFGTPRTAGSGIPPVPSNSPNAGEHTEAAQVSQVAAEGSNPLAGPFPHPLLLRREPFGYAEEATGTSWLAKPIPTAAAAGAVRQLGGTERLPGSEGDSASSDKAESVRLTRESSPGAVWSTRVHESPKPTPPVGPVGAIAAAASQGSRLPPTIPTDVIQEAALVQEQGTDESEGDEDWEHYPQSEKTSERVQSRAALKSLPSARQTDGGRTSRLSGFPGSSQSSTDDASDQEVEDGLPQKRGGVWDVAAGPHMFGYLCRPPGEECLVPVPPQSVYSMASRHEMHESLVAWVSDPVAVSLEDLNEESKVPGVRGLIYIAARMGNVPLLRALLERGVGVPVTPAEFMKPEEDDIEAGGDREEDYWDPPKNVRMELGVLEEELCGDGHTGVTPTPLYAACVHGHWPIVFLLLRHGHIRHGVDHWIGETPHTVMAAACKRDGALCMALLKALRDTPSTSAHRTGAAPL
eukprot:Hpha_TRINITY_DN36318_c0_g1::TRINITY_DN36318_c0_g1_i1::g.86412::m.86412